MLSACRVRLIVLGFLTFNSFVDGAEGLSSSIQRNCSTCHSAPLELISEAINLLNGVAWSSRSEQSSTKLKPHNNDQSIFQAIQLLHSASDIIERSSQSSASRRLEQDAPNYDDNDDYFAQYDDVKVTVEDNETVVTVSEDVIVVVEYGIYHYAYNCVMLLFCMMVGALMSGLLMGVMTLDPLMLGVKARAATTSKEREMATKLMPFSHNKNLVLVSILIVNCAVNEALPVFFDALLDNPLLSVLCSLTVVLLVGEILPSAYFTGRDQLSIAFRLIPVLRFVIILTAPVSYPLGKLMDKYFHEGDDRSAFKRGELSALVRLQYEERLASHRQTTETAEIPQDKSEDTFEGISNAILGPLNCVLYDPEHTIACGDSAPICQEMEKDIENDDMVRVEGALTLKAKKVSQRFTPLRNVVAISTDTILDENKIVELYSHGYSRIPVFQPFDNGSNIGGICGILLTKQLIMVRKEDRRLVSTLPLYRPPCVSPDTNFSDALNVIQAGNVPKSSNMALVCTNPDLARVSLEQGRPVPVEAGVLGIITLENILEELIQDQIYDEKDRKFKQGNERLKWVVAKWKAFTLKRRLEKEINEDDDDNPFNYTNLGEIV